jgi:TonB family protein
MRRLWSVVLVIVALAVSSVAVASAQQQEPRALKVIHQVAPVYPDEAKRAKVEGKVTLDVTVEENGEVSMATVVNGHRLLNQAAIDAVKQWRFSNPFNDSVTIQLTLSFALKETAAKNEQTVEENTLKNVRKVDAVYPDEAKRKGVEGQVVVDIKVNDNGEVTDARATTGDELLRQPALDAARQFRFANGFHKTVAATLTFNFVLK